MDLNVPVFLSKYMHSGGISLPNDLILHPSRHTIFPFVASLFSTIFSVIYSTWAIVGCHSGIFFLIYSSISPHFFFIICANVSAIWDHCTSDSASIVISRVSSLKRIFVTIDFSLA